MVGDTKPEHPLHPRRLTLSRRQLLMQGVVAVVILGSGIGIGTGGTVLALKNRIVPSVRWWPGGPPRSEPNVIAARWKEDYGLSDKQEQQIRDILTKQFTSLRESRQKLFQAEQTEREKSAVSLKKVFTPEQYAKWDQAMQDMAKQFERARASRGSRGDHKGPPRGERGPGRFMDPNGHRMDRPPRPLMDFEGGRGNRPPHGPMDPNGHHGPDRPPSQPVEFGGRAADVNAPK
jgi:hypothetical protein